MAIEELQVAASAPHEGAAGVSVYASGAACDLTLALHTRRDAYTDIFDALDAQAHTLAESAERIIACLRAGGKLLVAGNGGSAAEAQHFAAELVGRFKRERAPYAALALTTDTAALTAIAKDYGYEQVFTRQLLGLGRPGDLFLAFSTSGESANLLAAAQQCREHGIGVIAITGGRPNRLARLADVALAAPTPDTALAQEVHMMMTHLLCGIVETALASDDVLSPHAQVKRGLARKVAL